MLKVGRVLAEERLIHYETVALRVECMICGEVAVGSDTGREADP
jgi:ribosomal protein S27E